MITTLYNVILRYSWIMLLAILLLLTREVSMSSVLASSSTKLRTFMSLDLAAGLEKYLQHENKRLEVIRNSKGYEEEVPLVVERLEKLGSFSQALSSRKIDERYRTQNGAHPTTTLRYIRDFLDTWTDKLKNETLYGFRLREFLTNDKSELPSERDLEELARALVEIQYIYNLSTSDLYAGKVKGAQGSGLTPLDAYDLGRASFKLNHLKQAVIWFETALTGLTQKERETGNASFPVAETIANLGVIKYNLDEKARGIQLLEEAADLDPESDTIVKQYLSHRFGRDVPRLVENDPGEIKTHWFRLCANATSATASTQKWFHVCRYKQSPEAPYRVFREEIVSRSPYISLIHQFVTSSEADQLVNASTPKLSKDAVKGTEGLLYYAEGAILKTNAGLAGKIADRISDLTGLVTRETKGYEDHWVEGLQVFSYGLAGTYLPHVEGWYDPWSLYEHAGYRMASVLIYLSDVTAGGATAFTSLNITVIPRKGDALLWYNRKPDGELEENMVYSECPVAVGAKWVALQGVWSRDNELRRPCGRKKTSSHLFVDKLVASRLLPTP